MSKLDPDEAIPPTPPGAPVETLEELEAAPQMTEEQEIAFVSAARKSIVKQTMVNGKIPEDTEKQRLLLSALDGMDRSATARKRIKSESDASKNNAGSAAAVAEFLNTLANVRANQNNAPAASNGAPPPSLSADIVHHIRPEELVTGTHPVKAAGYHETGTLDPA